MLCDINDVCVVFDVNSYFWGFDSRMICDSWSHDIVVCFIEVYLFTCASQVSFKCWVYIIWIDLYICYNVSKQSIMFYCIFWSQLEVIATANVI